MRRTAVRHRVELHLEHGLVCGGHSQKDQLPHNGVQGLLRIELTIDQPLFDGGKVGITLLQRRVTPTVERQKGSARLFHLIHVFFFLLIHDGALPQGVGAAHY